MMLKPLETERLVLRPLEKSDGERMFLLDSAPEVMRYIGMPVLTERSQSDEVIRMIQQQYKDNGIGRFAVVEKKSNLLIGWSGLKLNREEVNHHQNFYEVGYRFLPEFWGKGYATESVEASLELAFNLLKLDEVYAYAHSENDASIRVLKKTGFLQNGTFEEDDGLCVWFEMPKEIYLKRINNRNK